MSLARSASRDHCASSWVAERFSSARLCRQRCVFQGVAPSFILCGGSLDPAAASVPRVRSDERRCETRTLLAASDERRSCRRRAGSLAGRTRIHNAALNLALLVIRDAISLRSEA